MRLEGCLLPHKGLSLKQIGSKIETMTDEEVNLQHPQSSPALSWSYATHVLQSQNA